MLVDEPRTFSVLGASGKAEQLPFTRSSLTLASEAVAKAGGVNPNLGDPAAIFVFAMLMTRQGNDVPTVYHINMMTAGASSCPNASP
jgi:polysaccharide export outer membrane protein